jgi:peptidoglycan hydrolase-like protein with peptidoglycan-binding domain
VREREPELRRRSPAIPRSPRTDGRSPRVRRRSLLAGLGSMMRFLLPRRTSDAVALLVAFTATVVVFVNALALQRPVHSAIAAPEVSKKASVPLPPKRTAAPAPAPMITPSYSGSINSLVPPANIPAAAMRTDNPAVKARVEMIVSVQRELSQRGYYDGALDGLPGPRTEQAIKEFEQNNGLRVTGEPNEQLLNQIRKARHRSEITGSIPRVEESKQSAQVLGVQRGLARLGYGPVRFTGAHDPATRAAIERFERDWGFPVTGEITPKLQSELNRLLEASLN